MANNGLQTKRDDDRHRQYIGSIKQKIIQCAVILLSWQIIRITIYILISTLRERALLSVRSSCACNIAFDFVCLLFFSRFISLYFWSDVWRLTLSQRTVCEWMFLNWCKWCERIAWLCTRCDQLKRQVARTQSGFYLQPPRALYSWNWSVWVHLLSGYLFIYLFTCSIVCGSLFIFFNRSPFRISACRTKDQFRFWSLRAMRDYWNFFNS